jgi:hypothetical protein
MHRVAFGSRRLFHTAADTSFNLKLNTLEFPNQLVFVGTESLIPLAEHLVARNSRRPLIVTDKGVFRRSGNTFAFRIFSHT